MATSHFLDALLQQPSTVRCGLGIKRSRALLATSVDTAFTSDTRKRGLLGRSGLPADTALVIAPCSAIHTFGMRFPIDVIFATRDGRVVKISRNLTSGRISVRLGAFAVIEMAAGEADRHGLQAGDVLVVHPLSSHDTTSPPPPRP